MCSVLEEKSHGTELVVVVRSSDSVHYQSYDGGRLSELVYLDNPAN
jgi:hypothetical protein